MGFGSVGICACSGGCGVGGVFALLVLGSCVGVLGLFCGRPCGTSRNGSFLTLIVWVFILLWSVTVMAYDMVMTKIVQRLERRERFLGFHIIVTIATKMAND